MLSVQTGPCITRASSLRMALPSKSAYHADSDADDEYEHSVMTSPTHLQTDSEASPTDSDPHSTENTPTTYGNVGDDPNSPRTIVTEWTAPECAQFLASLGLRQYCDAFIGKHCLTTNSPLCIRGHVFRCSIEADMVTCVKSMKSLERHWWLYATMNSNKWVSQALVIDSRS
jgi:hypothetical protein